VYRLKLRIATAAFVLALLILAGVSLAGYRTTMRLLEAAQWRHHTDEVIGEIQAMLGPITEMEAGAHRFVLTGHERFLEPFSRASGEIEAHLRQLRSLTADNPHQQQRLDVLEPIVRAKNAFMERTVALRRRDGLQAVVALVDTGQGKALMDDIRANLSAMGDEERRILVERESEMKASTRSMNLTLLAGAVTSFALLIGIFSVLQREIRKRTEAEQARAASEARLQAILDHSPAAIYLKDLEGRFRLVNRQVEIILNRTAAEIVGKTSFDLFPKDAAERLHANDLRVLEAGAPLTVEETVPVHDGQSTFLLTRFPLRDASGKMYAIGGVSTDITKRKRAEDEVKRTQAFLDSIVENIPNMIFVKDADTLRFVRLNHAGEQLLGFQRDALIGRNDHDFFPKEQADSFTARDRDVLKGGILQDIPEEPVRRQDGTERFLHTKKVPILDETGRPRYLLGISEDITERKAAQEQIEMLNGSLKLHGAQLESANKELEAFSYSVSHDLRAPLRHIIGFVDLLRQRAAAKLDDKAQRYMDTIAVSAKRMGDLIDDLLQFSRMSKNEIKRAKVPLSPMVADVLRELEGEVKGREIAWTIGALPEVEADPAMLRLVFANLISNAIKYTRTRDHARIEIGATNGGPEVVVCVRDNGVGFDMQYAHRLFGVFQRLHRTEDFDGTGIGLANVRRIIDRHGGRTWAEGEVDHGAAFYFSLPQHKETIR
jgi:PAS domain S-box-containing protein